MTPVALGKDFDAPQQDVTLYVEATGLGQKTLTLWVNGKQTKETITVNAFRWFGPLNVPQYGTYRYTIAQPPSGGKWLDPVGGVVEAGAGTSTMDVFWAAGPQVGKAVYQVAPRLPTRETRRHVTGHGDDPAFARRQDPDENPTLPVMDEPASKPTDRSQGTVKDGRFIRRVIVTVCITLLGLALALLLWYGVRVLLVAFAGVLLAVLLRSIAMAIARWTRLSPGWSLGITVLLLVGLFVGLGFLLAPSVVEQSGQMAERVPQAFGSLKQKLSSTPWGGQVLKILGRVQADGGGGGAAPTTQAVQKATGVVTATFAVVVDLLIILFLGIYLAAQPRLYVDGLAALFPPSKRPRICQVLNQLGHTLRWWLIAQGIDMVVIGVATALGLWALKIPLALVLGLLAALFNFIPNFGPLFSYVPAVLLALVEGPEKAIYVTILYVVLQCAEGYLLMPLLQRGAVDTPPAVLIGAQILLTLLVGGLGLALAAPLAACALIVVKMLYVHDVLGDPVELATRDEPPRPGGPAL